MRRSNAPCSGRVSNGLTHISIAFSIYKQCPAQACRLRWPNHLEDPMLRLTWTTFGLALVGVCLLVARTAATDLLTSLFTR